MSGKHLELPFEVEIVEYLTNHGWLPGTSQNYNRELALYPEDVVGWLHDTQQAEWDKLQKLHNGETQRIILERLAKCIETNGALDVLRRGFKDISATFIMCQFAASHTLTQVIQERYALVRLRVVRQLRYSLTNTNEIDLVLFINGIPIATMELKSDFSQSVKDAIEQYRNDRPVKDPRTKRDELLLKRSLVHFAVSMQEVAMTTELRGKETTFLPFNRGNNGAAGNPSNGTGHPTSYLWEEICQRDTFLTIVGRYMHVQKIKFDLSGGGKGEHKVVIFPRYHQWSCVSQLIETARGEGAGQRYLVQHSAGSGKTNSISWLAHQLTDLFDTTNNKVFDAVIVITDRNVLDSQLKEAIFQFDHKQGVIASIGEETGGSKSTQLADALANGTLIIIVTLQTFPFAMEQIKAGSLQHHRFAIIADEAHSSQSGNVARKLRQVLGMASGDDEGEIDAEDILQAQVKGGQFPANISYFAFTATPKAKTLELFGRLPDVTRKPEHGNLPQPFHVYTMQQAIEEGFILDVLKNYITYQTAFKLAYDGQEYDAIAGEENMVDEKKALRSLMRWVKVHPTTIAKRVIIIVEHFLANVVWRIDGRAKAMVVTGSRLEAVRYAQAMRAYISEHNYTNIGVLVAFSGDVADEETGQTLYNERNLNPNLRGQELRDAFKEDQYNVMLVANKFQTGFDQPMLVAMYVDKQLSGITAVQTLSRLNRTAPGKETTFVLDFVNDSEQILTAFQQYYRDAKLGGVSDGNIIHEIAKKLDDAQFYTLDDIERFAMVYVLPTHPQRELVAIIDPIAKRITAQYNAANEGNSEQDNKRKDEILLFRKDMQSYVRAYDFLSQLVDYGDTLPEKRSLFYRCLVPYLNLHASDSTIDLSQVILANYRVNKDVSHDLQLGAGSTESAYIYPLTEVGTKTIKDGKRVYLIDVVDLLNGIFDGEFSEADVVNYANLIRDKLIDTDAVKQQAQANTRERLLLSPDFQHILTQVMYEAMQNHNSMTAKLLENDDKMQQFREMIADMVHQSLSEETPPASD